MIPLVSGSVGFATHENDISTKEQVECITFVSQVMDLQTEFKEFAATVGKGLCEKAYEHYRKYLQELDAVEQDEAISKLTEYMGYVFKK